MDGLAVSKAVALIDQRPRDDREPAHLLERFKREMYSTSMSPYAPQSAGR